MKYFTISEEQYELTSLDGLFRTRDKDYGKVLKKLQKESPDFETFIARVRERFEEVECEEHTIDFPVKDSMLDDLMDYPKEGVTGVILKISKGETK